ncbi:sigma-54 dependent transcriptional regulator/response regulator [Lentisphaera araneosa HTCC2155]|uniref:Sigma-54 dependent transcriptional regulator/response regulator n=1 Tax=Lentisphaera araneosa HTCC2155 TaxID=313628 RepID=A6DT60_9BACT|nr:sigma-54 dependent transcriptional regulator [Lentisphaera araneosa]EDM25133.1 sigma-54 dependent transcriptional regulator/response regulator [Lentisphaera araneosa HTCC2155]
MNKKKILIVDDEIHTCQGLARALKYEWETFTASNGKEAIKIFEDNPVDIILTDVKMPGMNGIELLRQLKNIRPETPAIVMSAYNETETVVDAVKAGAYDFITKPFRLDDLDGVLKTAVQASPSFQLPSTKKATSAQLPAIAQTAKGSKNSPQIIYQSVAMENVLRTVQQIAPARSSVLITGETGTGKEVIAKAIHAASTRSKKAFIAVHCAALNANLFESELFGHEKGSFTGANEKRIGRFEAADGGTLFLDEIGEIDAATQVKLLRILESRSFERVGGNETLYSDARLIAATNRDLRKMVQAGEFREDLYYRLDVINLELPPLRDRREDIPALLQHWLISSVTENQLNVKGFTADAMARLCTYDWPGNVRELRNVVERMAVLSQQEYLDLPNLPDHVLLGEQQLSETAKIEDKDKALDVAENEKVLILKALKESNNNRTLAAERLGMSRRTLHRRLKQFGIT